MRGVTGTIAISYCFAVLLVGCASGGGGSGGAAVISPGASPPTTGGTGQIILPTGTPFTSWATAPFPGAYTLGGGGSRVRKTSVTSSAWLTLSPGYQDVILKFDAAGELVQAYIQEDDPVFWLKESAPATASSTTFSVGSGSLRMRERTAGDNITAPVVHFSYADPASSGFSYQTFGWWSAAAGGATPANYGGYSAGAITADLAIPTSGTAQFTGALAAQGLETNFATVAAPVTINVDFAGRNAAFSSASFRDAQGTVYAGTALTGVLTYAGQSNVLSGQLTSTAYTGSASGRFYGPGAEEIGGSFLLFPTDPNSNGRVVGGFGAKR